MPPGVRRPRAVAGVAGPAGLGRAGAKRARDYFTHAYLFARAETIYAGTSEVQLDVIAQRILKLPKD